MKNWLVLFAVAANARVNREYAEAVLLKVSSSDNCHECFTEFSMSTDFCSTCFPPRQKAKVSKERLDESDLPPPVVYEPTPVTLSETPAPTSHSVPIPVLLAHAHPSASESSIVIPNRKSPSDPSTDLPPSYPSSSKFPEGEIVNPYPTSSSEPSSSDSSKGEINNPHPSSHSEPSNLHPGSDSIHQPTSDPPSSNGILPAVIQNGQWFDSNSTILLPNPSISSSASSSTSSSAPSTMSYAQSNNTNNSNGYIWGGVGGGAAVAAAVVSTVFFRRRWSKPTVIEFNDLENIQENPLYAGTTMNENPLYLEPVDLPDFSS